MPALGLMAIAIPWQKPLSLALRLPATGLNESMSRWLKWNLVLPANTAARMNQCCQDDDMQKIYPSIIGSDCIVLAAPLYFYDWPAQLKLVIDRLYAFGPQYQIRHKETALLMTAADKDPQAFSGAEKSYELALVDYLQWKDRGRILVNGVNAAGSIQDNPALVEAYKLGFSI